MRPLDISQRQVRGLLSPADAATLLGISDRQLRALTCSGAIRYVNIGLGTKREARRYDPADLAQFMEERRCQSSRGQDNRSTATTSAVVVHDFQELRLALQNAKRNGSKTKSAPPRKPR